MEESQQPQSAPTAAVEPAITTTAASLEADLAAAIEAANAERDAPPAPSTRSAQAGPSGEPSEPAAEGTASAPPGKAEDDDEPNPSLPKLTRGETRALFEQWEAERRPRFFKDLESARDEAERLKAEAAAAEQANQAAQAGYDEWYGEERRYRAAAALYDTIVERIQRGEYIPDAEVGEATWFKQKRDNRGMSQTVYGRELTKVLSNVDHFFRTASVEGIDVPQVLADVTARRGTPGDVLAEVAKRVRTAVEAEWKGKYEAERAAHQTTRQRFGLGRAPTGVSGGRAPTRGDLVSTLANGSSAEVDDFIERAKRGEFSDVDLSDR